MNGGAGHLVPRGEDRANPPYFLAAKSAVIKSLNRVSGRCRLVRPMASRNEKRGTCRCPKSPPAFGSTARPRRPRNSTFRCCPIPESKKCRKTTSTAPPERQAPCWWWSSRWPASASWRSTAAPGSNTPTPSRSGSTAPIRPRSTACGMRCLPMAGRSNDAAGSKTVTACPGRSCRPRSCNILEVPAPPARGGRWRPCCRWSSSTSPGSREPMRASQRRNVVCPPVRSAALRPSLRRGLGVHVDDLNAAVDRVHRRARILRLALAIADGDEIAAIDAELLGQVPLDRIGAALGEALVEFFAADRIGVTGDHECRTFEAGIRERLAEFLHCRHRARSDRGRVVVELNLEIDFRLGGSDLRDFLALAERERAGLPVAQRLDEIDFPGLDGRIGLRSC